MWRGKFDPAGMLKMLARQSISDSAFVVWIPEESLAPTFRKRLEKLGTVEVLPGYPDRLLLHVTSTPADPKTAWQHLREALGPDVKVEPVFLDEAKRPQYATGTVTVRFQEAPSDAELAEWEHKRGLRVKARNKYVPNQITFQPLDHTRFLPELLEEIKASAESVTAVWADTLSRYQRAAQRLHH